MPIISLICAAAFAGSLSLFIWPDIFPSNVVGIAGNLFLPAGIAFLLIWVMAPKKSRREKRLGIVSLLIILATFLIGAPFLGK